ncbi:hypothetical protein [Paenibacillus apiarius]|uniref:hypothetical protein n=1 Tax=Paenibacillus apiarius TaxID=46240 RepID=UPI003B3B6574
MKYVVLKDFLDRFDNMRHCKPGESHEPPNDERAQQLIKLGFIEIEEPSRKGTEKQKAKNKGVKDGEKTDDK